MKEKCKKQQKKNKQRQKGARGTEAIVKGCIFVFSLILITRTLITKVLFNDFID